MTRDHDRSVSGILRAALTCSAVLAPGPTLEAATPIPGEVRFPSERAPHLNSALLFSQAPSPKERAKMGSAPLSLTDKPVVCRLTPTSGENEERAPTIPEVVKTLAPGRKLFLVVKDLRTNLQPGVLYNLYLDLPDGASPQEAEAHFAGAVNFFNALVSNDPPKAARSERFMSFDVTALVKTLSARNQLKKAPTLTLVPDGTPVSAAKPLIGEISLIEQ